VPVTVKLRSMSQPAPARVSLEGGNLSVRSATVLLEEPQFGIAPGQACVFYQGERLLGGGWICRDNGAA